MRCEDFPCCGHELGCCPDYDKSGKQLNMKCTCGATLPIGSRYSICDSCLNRSEDRDFEEDRDERHKPCPECDDDAFMDKHCGVFVCDSCGHHIGLARCYCGWSESGGNGHQELLEMGENIDEDY